AVSVSLVVVCSLFVVLVFIVLFFFFFQAEDGIRDRNVTGVQTCALPISCTAWMPRTMSSGQVSISWVSLVSQTSLSEALISRVSTGLLGCSFTSVGKPAPPRPTRPLARTAARKLALSVTTGGRMDGSTVCLPSVWMTTESHSLPFARRNGSTADTLPDTLEWMLAETKPPASPISVPTQTSSPFL